MRLYVLRFTAFVVLALVGFPAALAGIILDGVYKACIDFADEVLAEMDGTNEQTN